MKLEQLINDIYLIILWYFYINVYKTALYLAIEKGNIEIVKLILMREDVDVNIINIFY